jgi:RNA polymerase sigma factor (TIGR02999 family)
MTNSSELTQIIHQWQSGNKDAENQLYQFAYLHLRRIAKEERQRSAEKYGVDNDVISDCMNSTTALIHDAYIKLSNFDLQDISSKREFFLMISNIMRQILIDNARTLQAKKRQPLTNIEQDNNRFELFVIMDKMLDSFSARYPRQSNVLKLKYLMGLQNKEICTLLECSSSLIEKDLKFSRCWLQSRMA